MAGGFFGRLFGRHDAEEHQQGFVVASVPTSEDLLASLARVEAMVSAGAVPAPVASRVRRVDRVVRDTIPRLASLGAGQPPGLLRDGDRDRLPAGSGWRLSSTAATVRRQPSRRPGEVLTAAAHRPAGPPRLHDGPGVRRRVPRRCGRPRGSRAVPAGEVREHVAGGALDVGSAPLPAMPDASAPTDAGSPVPEEGPDTGELRLRPPARGDA